MTGPTRAGHRSRPSRAAERSSPGRALRTAGAALAAAVALAACEKAPPPQGTAQVAESLAAIVATCAAVVGDVEVRRAGKETWSPVTTGAVLRDGDAIRTGPGAFARVAFVSGNGIELEEGATAVVDVTSRGAAAGGGGEEGTERVRLASGVARGFLADGASGAARALAIRTADGREARLSAAEGEQGVRFRLTATPAGTEIAVTAGAASVAGAEGAVSVAAGRAVDVGPAGVGAPVELIGFPRSLRPGVDARFALSPGLAVDLAWEDLPGASGYRVQVAKDLSFREVVLARDLAGTELRFAPAGEGMHAWRVAARDATGRHGEYGFARRVYVDAAPPRDLLLAPEPDAVVRGGARARPLRFAWTDEPKGRRYRVVIASGPELTERAVRSETVSGGTLELRDLEPGTYWWGVYVDDERRDPLFVAPRRLVLPPRAPTRVKVQRTVSDWGR
jgi:hypothetical protein